MNSENATTTLENEKIPSVSNAIRLDGVSTEAVSKAYDALAQYGVEICESSTLNDIMHPQAETALDFHSPHSIADIKLALHEAGIDLKELSLEPVPENDPEAQWFMKD